MGRRAGCGVAGKGVLMVEDRFLVAHIQVPDWLGIMTQVALSKRGLKFLRTWTELTCDVDNFCVPPSDLV